MPSKDFTRAAQGEPTTFTIDDDVFECSPRLAGGLLLDIAKLKESPPQEQLDALTDFLDAALLPASAARFAERLRSTTEPIDISQALDVVVWLIEEVYFDRPSVPSSGSEASSATASGGTTSTAGAPSTE